MANEKWLLNIGDGGSDLGAFNQLLSPLSCGVRICFHNVSLVTAVGLALCVGSLESRVHAVKM